jgi:hypothetical protein
MTDCTQRQMVFPFYRHRALTANFKGGDISSDGGMLLIRQLDERVKIVERVIAALTDRRDRRYIDHELITLLRQRIYQLAAGYEDCNDATTLRTDPVFKLCCDRTPEASDVLASQPTLSRLENSITGRELYRLAETLLELYVRKFTKAPRRIILDIDSTDDPTYGAQQLSFFNGFYREHMYHPLLVFDGLRGDLLGAVLRPGNAGASTDLMPVLKRVVTRLRHQWKHVRIIVRADAGFAIPDLYSFCEEHGIDYVVGFYGIEPLKTLNKPNVTRAHRHFKATGCKVRHLTSTLYRARSWNRRRRVLMKTEVSAEGLNERFVITSLRGKALRLYDFYAERGGVENQMIKELKLDLHSDRLSCHRFLANQFRLLLHGFAYVLLHRLRGRLRRTDWASARIDSLRLRLLKIGARVVVSCRRVWVLLASGYPYRMLWQTLFDRLTLASGYG